MSGYPWRYLACGIVSFFTFVAPTPAQTVVDDPFQARVGALDQVALEFRAAGITAHATRATDVRRDGDTYSATLATDDPVGRTIAVRIAPAGDGIAELEATGPPGTEAMRARFARAPGERFLGFGERSDAVVRTSGTVENRVTEGPYQDAEATAVAAFVPPPGYNTRHDATYFPIPWVLSSRGYGLLVREDEPSRVTLGSPWSVDVDGRRLTYRVYAGPRPADALRRFTADVGRQPPAAAPFYFGPWWQPKGDATANLATLRRAGALGSVVQTYTHYLPCADHVARGGLEPDLARRMHAAGLAVTTYFNPMICTSHPRFDEAAAHGWLTEDALGRPYTYRYTGSSTFFVGQVDFTAPGASAFYGDLLDEAVRNGYDGWMEDFGEYTPTDARSADGTPGTAMHNRYVERYHAAARAYARDRAPRPLARFNRSGWTGSARSSQLVWGGDPSTGWDFDGLRSAVRNGLSMGLSGVSLWGSDIGGFFALSLPQTTPELLRRWIELGFASGVMRTQANGFSLAPSKRAQIFDDDVLPVWTRYARLRTQLQPYLTAAEREYDATGLPLMRALALTYPDDPRAVDRDDEYLLGGDLLVAPVLDPGATTRTLYLPRGRWVDLWRSVTLGGDGAPRLRAPVVLRGGREVPAPAPADELPLFVRAGAALPLLPADVQTLSPYGGRGVVHLADRPARRTLLAWPVHGVPSSRAAPADDAVVRSGLHRSGTWVARVRQKRRRRLDLQVALDRRPCALLVAGRRRAFAYARGALRASVPLRSGTVTARAWTRASSSSRRTSCSAARRRPASRRASSPRS